MANNKLQGVHHIAVKPTKGNYEKTVKFYTELLGMETKYSWGDPQYPCLLLSCGDNSFIEVLTGDSDDLPAGPFAHVAFATDKVDEIVEEARALGYQITDEPKDVMLGDMPVRVAFFYGPTHEHVELFWVK